MPKTILPPRTERAVIKSRLTRLDEWKAKNDAKYHRESERLRVRLLELEPPTKKPEVSEDDLPSFMRSTMVSRVRTAQSPRKPTAKQEGTLHRVEVPKKRDPYPAYGWEGPPSYARSTDSSTGKITYPITIRRPRQPYTDVYEEYYPSDPTFDDDCWVPPDDLPILNPTDQQVANRVYKGMSDRTRLHDSLWEYEELPFKVWIPAQLNFQLTGDGLELARQGFWEFCCEQVPSLRQEYHMGPSSVRFGYSEMANVGVHFHVRYADPSCRVSWALDSLTHVRNRYCHFKGGYNAESLDGDLRAVQKILVAVGDEERALRAWGLREQLKEAAEQSLAELKTLGLLSSLPHHGGLDWAPHHERFFRAYVEYFKKNHPKHLDIIQAIETWSERRSEAGKD